MNRGLVFLFFLGALNFFCINAYSQVTTCAYDVTSTVVPAPINCTYFTADTVQICFSIGGFSQSASNWIHGFVFDLGSGWDKNSLKVIKAPYSCSDKGYWKYYNSDTSQASGEIFGPGIYYNWCTPFDCDSLPGDNYGDENSGFCTWNFCVQIVAGKVPSNDLHFGVMVTSDGVTGKWTTPPACYDDTFFDAFVLSDSACSHISSIFKCNMTVSTIATNPGCVPNSGAITVNQTGGVPNITYQWSNNGNTTATNSNLGPGTYIVTVTDGHKCIQYAFDTLRIDDSTRINISVLDTVFCLGHCTGRLAEQNLSGTPPYNILWSDGEKTDTIKNLCTGNYKVVVTDKHQCKDSATVDLSTPPTLRISFVTKNATCYNLADGSAVAIVTPSNLSYSYYWFITGNTKDTISTIDSLNKAGAGNYSIIVREFNGCITTGDTVISQPPRINIDLKSQNILCYNTNTGSMQVAATSGFSPFTYLWSNGSTNPSITQLKDTLYSVTITDNTGCSTDTSLTLTQPDPLRIDFTTYPASCDKATDGYVFAQVYGGTTPYTYLWNNKEHGDTDTSLSPGDYFVTITDANKCQDTGSSHLVAFERFTVNAGPDQEIVKGYSTIIGGSPSSPGSYSFEWAPPETAATPFNSVTTVTPTITTTYTVTATNTATGCEASDDVIVKVLPNPFLFVPNAFSPNGDAYNNTIFPIPGDGVTIKTFAVFNRWGVNVYNGSGSNRDGWDGNYNGVPQDIGIYTYYCLYTLPDGTESRKDGTILLLR